MRLPFALGLALPGEGDAVVDLIVHCETAEREDLEPSDEMVRIFLMAINSQMFSDRVGSTTVAQAAMLDSMFDAHARAWKYVLKVRALPFNSLPVLIALLAQTRYAGDPITRVTFRPEGESDGDIRLEPLIDELGRSPVPPPSVPFEIEWSDAAFATRSLMLTFEFKTAVHRSVVERFESALNVWDHLLMFGGFKFDFTENEKFWPRIGRTAHLSPTLITHALDVFDAPLFALNCVFKCAAAVHDQGSYLKTVALE